MGRSGARRSLGAALAVGIALAGGSAAAQPAPSGLAGPAAGQAAPSPRIALVVGEGAYRAGPMPAAPNDAGLVAQVLAGAGFEVTGARDLDGDGLRRAFRDFLDRAAAAGPDGVAVVYFAGRAAQFDGDDYLVPVDARLARPADLPIEALRLADYTHALGSLPIQARVVVVDGAYAGGPAGLTGPGADAPGLALAEAEQGELLAFNAAPGTVAPAAPAAAGPYGVYAQALAEAMKAGGVPVGEVFARVRLSVNGSSGGAVVPWDSDRLTRSFAFFDRAPGAPAVASAQVPFAALEKRPLSSFPPGQAYDVALARDTLPAYAEFLAAFPGDPLARRVRLILAVRREASFWRAAVSGNAPGSYWTYLARYPRGPHAADARRRLARLAAAAAPPPRFVPLAFDVPPPGPDEAVVDGVLAFDAPGLPPPPPPPVFLLPPPVEVVVVRPPPPAGPLLLPVPVPVAIPYVRPPVEPGTIAPPRGAAAGYARPRPYARGPNGDGLVVQAAPPPAAPPPAVLAVPAVAVPPETGGAARPRPAAAPVAPSAPTAPAVVPLPQPPAAAVPRGPTSPASPSHALPVPPEPAAPPLPGAAAVPQAAPSPAPPAAPLAAPPHQLHPAHPAHPGDGSTAAAPQPSVAPVAPSAQGSVAAPGAHRAPVAPAPQREAAPNAAPVEPSRPPAASRLHRALDTPPATPAAPAAAAPAPRQPAPRPDAPPPDPALQRPASPRPAAHPAPERPPEQPRAAAPASSAPPARRAPDGQPVPPPASAGRPAPDHAAPDHPAGERRPAERQPGDHHPGERRAACGHPGEPPCHP